MIFTWIGTAPILTIQPSLCISSTHSEQENLSTQMSSCHVDSFLVFNKIHSSDRVISTKSSITKSQKDPEKNVFNIIEFCSGKFFKWN